MKLKDWLIIALLAVIIFLQWTDRVPPDYDPTQKYELQKKYDSLQIGNAQLKLVNDSLLSVLAADNVTPVKKKHEKIRNDIAVLPVDSQIILFSKRFSKGSN